MEQESHRTTAKPPLEKSFALKFEAQTGHERHTKGAGMSEVNGVSKRVKVF
jgi:hypothetical protein